MSEITPDHAAALHYRLYEKPIMANQVVSLLSRLFHEAAKSGEASAGGNPCLFIKKYPTPSRERFLSEQEFDRLGRVLTELEIRGTISTSAAAALRVLMLTGCRRNEIVTLRWEHVDLEHDELRLRDAKTGARAVPLSPAAIQVLTALRRRSDNPSLAAAACRAPSGRPPDRRFSSNGMRFRAVALDRRERSGA